MLKITFFGHSHIYNSDTVRDRVKNTIMYYMEKDDCEFKVGRYGEYDKIVTGLLSELIISREIYASIVFISDKFITRNDMGISDSDLYEGFHFLKYEIDDCHFKTRITMTNRFMVDDSDILICYVDEDKKSSGALKAMKYAIKQNKIVINLFKKEDSPFYGLSEEEKERRFNEFLKLH